MNRKYHYLTILLTSFTLYFNSIIYSYASTASYDEKGFQAINSTTENQEDPLSKWFSKAGGFSTTDENGISYLALMLISLMGLFVLLGCYKGLSKSNKTQILKSSGLIAFLLGSLTYILSQILLTTQYKQLASKALGKVKLDENKRSKLVNYLMVIKKRVIEYNGVISNLKIISIVYSTCFALTILLTIAEISLLLKNGLNLLKPFNCSGKQDDKMITRPPKGKEELKFKNNPLYEEKFKYNPLYIPPGAFITPKRKPRGRGLFENLTCLISNSFAQKVDTANDGLLFGQNHPNNMGTWHKSLFTITVTLAGAISILGLVGAFKKSAKITSILEKGASWILSPLSRISLSLVGLGLSSRIHLYYLATIKKLKAREKHIQMEIDLLNSYEFNNDGRNNSSSRQTSSSSSHKQNSSVSVSNEKSDNKISRKTSSCFSIDGSVLTGDPNCNCLLSNSCNTPKDILLNAQKLPISRSISNIPQTINNIVKHLTNGDQRAALKKAYGLGTHQAYLSGSVKKATKNLHNHLKKSGSKNIDLPNRTKTIGSNLLNAAAKLIHENKLDHKSLLPSHPSFGNIPQIDKTIDKIIKNEPKNENVPIINKEAPPFKKEERLPEQNVENVDDFPLPTEKNKLDHLDKLNILFRSIHHKKDHSIFTMIHIRYKKTAYPIFFKD